MHLKFNHTIKLNIILSSQNSISQHFLSAIFKILALFNKGIFAEIKAWQIFIKVIQVYILEMKLLFYIF